MENKKKERMPETFRSMFREIELMKDAIEEN